jgi:hypothetical protein
MLPYNKITIRIKFTKWHTTMKVENSKPKQQNKNIKLAKHKNEVG